MRTEDPTRVASFLGLVQMVPFRVGIQSGASLSRVVRITHPILQMSFEVSVLTMDQGLHLLDIRESWMPHFEVAMF